jgi:hypothetical protein
MQDLVRLAEQREAAAKAEIAAVLPSKAAIYVEKEGEGGEEEGAGGGGAEQGEGVQAAAGEQAPGTPTTPAARVSSVLAGVAVLHIGMTACAACC